MWAEHIHYEELIEVHVIKSMYQDVTVTCIHVHNIPPSPSATPFYVLGGGGFV